MGIAGRGTAGVAREDELKGETREAKLARAQNVSRGDPRDHRLGAPASRSDLGARAPGKKPDPAPTKGAKAPVKSARPLPRPEPKPEAKSVREARLAPPKFEPKGRPAGLTKNEKLLWDVLATQDGPLKAYEILDLLKEKGVRAPMTVYRALDGLEDKGVIHKLDAMKAFVRCNHEGPHEVQAFLVCEICSFVKEIEIDAVATGIVPIVRRAGFDMHVARLEVRGVCDNCICEKHNHAPGKAHDHGHGQDCGHDHDH
jgi:Fur family zinc uptake transcriptional regulator